MKPNQMILGRRGVLTLGFLVTSLAAPIAAAQTPAAVAPAAAAPAAVAPAAVAPAAVAPAAVAPAAVAVVPGAPATPTPVAPAGDNWNAPTGPTDSAAPGVAAADAATPSVAPVARPRVARPMAIPIPLAAPEPPPPPPKSVFPWAASFDVATLWQKSKGFDLFSNDDVIWRVGLSAERDLLEVMPKAYLSAGFSWSNESASDTILDGRETALSVNNLTLGARLRKDWLPVLSTHASLFVGASRIKSDVGFGDPVVDWVPNAQIGGGVTAQLPRAGDVCPGLLAEGGYFFSGSTELRVKSSTDGSSLEYITPELGTLERSGPFLRFSAFIRY